MEKLQEENLVVSEKYQVYSNSQILSIKNSLTKSDVVYTGTSDCSLRCGSFDQIAELVNNASARKSTSSWSDIEVLAVPRNPSYSIASTNSIDSSISFCLISNSCSERLDLNRQSSLYLSNSDFINSGAINLALIEKNKYEATENGFMIENRELLSNTSIILVYPYSSLFSGDIELSNSSLLFGDISESNLLNRPFLAILPSSTDHRINSCSSLEFNLSSNFILLSNSCLISSDKFIQRNLEISFFNSSVAASVTDAIYILPSDFNFSNFLSSSILSDITFRESAATFISGNSFLNSFNNLSGIDIVILGILLISDNYLNEHKYVEVYKDFDLEQVTGGKEIYFLNLDNESVKFESTTKEDYDGKTYDVVLLTVEGTDCDGEEIDLFVIWEDDLIGDDSVNNNPASISFSDGKAVSSWVVEYQDDCFGEPEYYFVSSLKSDDSVRIDSRDYGELLRVSEAGGYKTGGCPNYVWTGVR